MAYLELEALRREVALSDNPSIVYYSKEGDKRSKYKSQDLRLIFDANIMMISDSGNCNNFLISFLSVITSTIGIGYGPAHIMVDANAVILALKKEFPVPEIDPVCLHNITY
jgi:hypothetical protein